jgi:hypothetical protein
MRFMNVRVGVPMYRSLVYLCIISYGKRIRYRTIGYLVGSGVLLRACSSGRSPLKMARTSLPDAEFAPMDMTSSRDRMLPSSPA